MLENPPERPGRAYICQILGYQPVHGVSNRFQILFPHRERFRLSLLLGIEIQTL